MKPLIPLALIVLAATPAGAESNSATMNVSVRVIARTVLAIDQPSTISITNQNISRGYVDVPAVIVLRVQTNDRRGYLLHASKIGAAFESIELSTPGARMNVAENAWLYRPYNGGADVMEIRARLHLGSGAQPGIRALPVRFDATPLD